MTEETPTKASLQELIQASMIDDGPIDCAVCTVDAAMAKALLEMNTTNRPLSNSQVKLYANEMLRGKWKLNGEALIFGSDDEGNDSIISGQHRLHALILANKLHAANPSEYENATLKLTTVIIFGVAIETADSVDLGMNRKHGHVIYRDEFVDKVIPKEWSNNNSRKAKWCNTLAGAARLVWLRCGGATVSSAPKFIVSEMMEFIKEDHKNLCHFVSAVLSASEEEGAGLKISVPYIAGLCYMASLDSDGKLHKDTMNTLLDAVLCIAQNKVDPGTAEHALVTYWNKLFSTPGSKDRDLEIVGPFVKALNAIIVGEKTTAAKIALTKKEQEGYAAFPPLLSGYDEACFEYAAEVKANAIAAAETAKEQAQIQKEEARIQKEKDRAEKEAAKAIEVAAKEKEKAAAKAEVEAAKSKVPVKSGVMSVLTKAVKTANDAKAAKTNANAEVSAKPMIKRKPVPASK
jgi:hypothetical protein